MLAVIAFRKLGLAYGLVCALTVAVPLSAGQFWGFSRIALSATPIFLVLAMSTTRPWFSRALLMFGIHRRTVLLGFFFVHGLGVN